MKDDQWIEQLKKRMDMYAEPLPDKGWERLEKELMATAANRKEPPRAILFRRWSMAAAAAILIGLSVISLWLIRHSESGMINEIPYSTMVSDNMMQQEATPSVTENQKRDEKRASERESGQEIYSQSVRTAEVKTEQPASTQPSTVDVKEDTTPPEEKRQAAQKQKSTPDNVSEETVRKPHRPLSQKPLVAQLDKEKNPNRHRWSIGMALGNGGGTSNSTASSLLAVNNRLDFSTMANDAVNVPAGQEVVFEGGLPYLKNQIEDNNISIHHKLPVNVGFSVRMALAKGFSIESGLTYTYLASDITYEGRPEKIKQKLHYIGIPLKGNWEFLKRKEFNLYLSAGGSMEKCVYGKTGTEQTRIKPLQYSVMGSVGAQYGLSRHFALYVEPGISYFFDDGSSVQTIRKENPLNFNLQTGIRLTY